MSQETQAALHDAYAADYDDQICAYDCHLAEALFGLCYEYTQTGQTLLDLGIGSGLSAALFARAGLKVHGADFSPAMLTICQARGIAVELKQLDLQQTPWPYPPTDFDHLICCGVFHFIPDLEDIFQEAGRVLKTNGTFGFTTKIAPPLSLTHPKYHRQTAGDFDIFSHLPEYLTSLIEKNSFRRLKTLKCLVGEDVFSLYVLQKSA